jgi:hypothetical protein
MTDPMQEKELISLFSVRHDISSNKDLIAKGDVRRRALSLRDSVVILLFRLGNLWSV